MHKGQRAVRRGHAVSEVHKGQRAVRRGHAGGVQKHRPYIYIVWSNNSSENCTVTIDGCGRDLRAPCACPGRGAPSNSDVHVGDA